MVRSGKSKGKLMSSRKPRSLDDLVGMGIKSIEGRRTAKLPEKGLRARP